MNKTIIPITVIIISFSLITILTVSYPDKEFKSETVKEDKIEFSGTVVHGTINADSIDVRFEDITVYVKLVDASLQDVSSVLLGEQTLENVNYDSRLRYAGILFSIPVEFQINESATCYVSAHADIDGDGRTSKGDWVSMTAHPVLSHGNANEASIILSLVE